MIQVNLSEAKANLSRYVRQARAGERVVLCERNVPVVELRAIPSGTPLGKSSFGLSKGLFTVGPEFFQADADILEDFEQSGNLP